MKYNAISLFTGAMGLDLGMEKSGMNICACVENNKFCCETIRLNKPHLPIIEKDIEKTSSEDVLKMAGLKKSEVFVIFGGPPCQAFSTAGSRQALQDIRGNCVLEFVKKVQEIQPRYFVMENVRGLLSAAIIPISKSKRITTPEEAPGSVLKYIVRLYEEAGYTVSFALFNSANYGVPQIRERLIFFGNRGKKRIPLPQPTHTENNKITGKKWMNLREALKGFENTEHHYVEFSENRKKYYRMLKEGQNWRDLPLELQAEAMGASYHLGGGKTGFYRRLSWSRPSPTIVTRPNMPATDLAHPTELRPLSIEEYMAIQQFPKKWKIAGNLIEQYKQIGNAVPVSMGFVAGKTLIDFHEGKVKEENGNGVKYSRYNGTTDIDFKSKEASLFENANSFHMQDA